MDPVRIGLLAISGWVVAAVMTVAVSWSAISVVRQSVVPQTNVASALPAPVEGTSTAAPATTRPSPSPTVAALQSVSGQGGMVTARCTNGVPTIVKFTPQQGFTAERDDSGREVQFRSSDHRTEITLACTGGKVAFSKEEKAISASGGGGGGGDDNGGDDNGGGSGRGRGGGGGGDN
jgi:uncharacterized membrane protein YgcG